MSIWLRDGFEFKSWYLILIHIKKKSRFSAQLAKLKCWFIYNINQNLHLKELKFGYIKQNIYNHVTIYTMYLKVHEQRYVISLFILIDPVFLCENVGQCQSNCQLLAQLLMQREGFRVLICCMKQARQGGDMDKLC